MHEVLVNRLGGLSLPRKSVVRLTDRPDMTLDVYRGRKTSKEQTTMTGLCPRMDKTGVSLKGGGRRFSASIPSLAFIHTGYPETTDVTENNKRH